LCNGEEVLEIQLLNIAIRNMTQLALEFQIKKKEILGKID